METNWNELQAQLQTLASQGFEGVRQGMQILEASLLKTSAQYKSFLFLQAQCEDVARHRFQGDVLTEELTILQNRLIKNFLYFIDQLKPQDFYPPGAKPTEDGSFEKGKLLFDIPSKMRLMEETRCLVRVAPTQDLLLRNLIIKRQPREEEISISDRMEVSLIDPSENSAFKIRAISRPVQRLIKSDYTEWVFYVTPLREGKFPLEIKVSVVLPPDDVHEVAFHEKIQVVATPFSKEKQHWKEAGLVVVTAVGGMQSGGTPSKPARQGYSKILSVATLVLSSVGLVLAGVGAAVVASLLIWNHFENKNPPQRPSAEQEIPSSQPLDATIVNAWDSTKNIGTIEAYQEFIEQFPESELADSAKEVIKEMDVLAEKIAIDSAALEEQAWELASATHTIPAYQTFVKSFPKRRYAAEAHRRIAALEELAAWESARRQHTCKAYQKFIRAYPKSAYLQPAKDAAGQLCQPKPPPVEAPGASLISVPGGEFLQGCTGEQNNDCYPEEKPAHRTRVKPFFISKYEVTNDQYALFLNEYGSDRVKAGKFKKQKMVYEDERGVKLQAGKWQAQPGFEKCPVVNVTWYGANEFAEFYDLRLPTEAEWEYAARGGAKSGGFKYAGGNKLETVAYFTGNSHMGTRLVGRKKANELGLHDMSGNAAEWCRDGRRRYGASPAANEGKIGDGFAVVRGGSWKSPDWNCRLTRRLQHKANDHHNYIGFRCAKDGE